MEVGGSNPLPSTSLFQQKQAHNPYLSTLKVSVRCQHVLLILVFLFTSYQQAFCLPIVTPEEPSEDTFYVGSFSGTYDATSISSFGGTYSLVVAVSSMLTDYIELDAFKDIPYSINYRRMNRVSTGEQYTNRGTHRPSHRLCVGRHGYGRT